MVSRMTRLPDWMARLSAELDRQRRIPFAWGEQDCVLGFAAKAVEAITGTDLAEGYRERYRTPLGAVRLLRDEGADSLGDFVGRFLPEIEPNFADIGDVAVVASDGPIGQALGIVDATGLIVMTTEGHGRLDRAEMLRAFRVG